MNRISNMGQGLDQIERLKRQQTLVDRLSLQLTSGKKTQRFSELGSGALTSKQARATIKAINSYRSNIQNADRRMELSLLSMGEFRAQAETWSGMLVQFSQETVHQQGNIVYYDDPLTAAVDPVEVGMDSATPDIDFQGIQDMANNMFDVMVDLLNTQDDTGRYLFGGAETLTKPLDDKGLMDSAISQLVTDWKNGTITTDELIADIQDRTTANGNTDAITDTIVGYSPALSAGNVDDVYVRVDEGVELEYGSQANKQVYRDILVGLAFLKNENLPPMADVYAAGDPPYPAPPSVQGAPGATLEEMKENFFAVYNSVVQMVNGAIKDMENEQFNMESVRARMQDTDARHVATKNLLQTTVSDIEDSDMNEVAVKINTLQVQLEASYRLTALIADLSLVNFI